MKQQLDHLYDALEFLNGLTESNDIKIWSRLLEKLSAALKAESAAYFFFDTVARQLVPFYRLGSSPGAAATPIPMGEGLSGWVAKYREPLLAANAAKDARYRKDIDDAPGVPARSVLCVPLSVHLDFVGTFSFLNKSGGPFDDEDQRLATTVCSQAALAIRRLRLEEMVGRVTAYNSSILDNLSGGFLAVDIQGRVMICNPAARRILGLQGEVTDIPVEDALPGMPDLAAVLRKTLSSQQVVKRRELSCNPGGHKRLLGYSTLLIQDPRGNFIGAGITFQDITTLPAE